MGELVSVIMPTYNRGYVIQKAIDSVLAQTYKDWELIIVDDGSTDDTESVVKNNDDKRIRYIKYSPNKGANHARNVGLDNAKGKWLTLLDSDAVYDVDSLANRIECIKYKRADIVWTRTNFVDPKNGNLLFPSEEESILNNIESMIPLSLVKGLINTSTLMFSRRCYEDGYTFDENLLKFQDWDFFWRLILDISYKCYFFDKVTVTNFTQENSISNVVPACEIYVKLIEKHIETFRKYGVMVGVLELLLSFSIWGKDHRPVFKLFDKLNENEIAVLFDKLFERNKNLSDCIENIRKTKDYMDWRFPYGKIFPKARVIIYGAGDVGSSFVRQIAENHYCSIVLLVDKNHENLGSAVRPPKDISKCIYDYVLVAIQNREIAKSAFEYLVKLGIAEGKIILL